MKKPSERLVRNRLRAMLPTCPVCLEAAEFTVGLACGHSMCSACIVATVNRDMHTCPECRADARPRSVTLAARNVALALAAGNRERCEFIETFYANRDVWIHAPAPESKDERLDSALDLDVDMMNDKISRRRRELYAIEQAIRYHSSRLRILSADHLPP